MMSTGENTVDLDWRKTNHRSLWTRTTRWDYEYDVHMCSFSGSLHQRLLFVNFWVNLGYVGRTVGPNRKLSLFLGFQKGKTSNYSIGQNMPCVSGRYQKDHTGVLSSVFERPGPWDTWRSFSFECRTFWFGMISEAKMTAKRPIDPYNKGFLAVNT